MIKPFFLLLFFLFGLFIHSAYSQKRKSNGLVPSRGGDPFSGRRNIGKIRLHFGGTKSRTGKLLSKGGKKKEYSRQAHQANNRNAYRGNMASKGIHRQYSVASDSFSRKSKKKYKSTGPRGDTFHKKKYGGILKLGSHRGRETRRMDRSNKHSFKK